MYHVPAIVYYIIVPIIIHDVNYMCICITATSIKITNVSITALISPFANCHYKFQYLLLVSVLTKQTGKEKTTRKEAAIRLLIFGANKCKLQSASLLI